MKTVLHIFLKDVRQMRWTLALWLVLLAVQLQAALSTKQATLSDWDKLSLVSSYGGLGYAVGTALHWLGLAALTFEVVLADRPCGTEAFWKTRPIARWHVWAAKFVFLVLFAALLPAGSEWLNFTLQGIPLVDAARSVALSLLGQLHVLSWMMLVALLCKWRTWKVWCLAPLSVALPLLVWRGAHQFSVWLPEQLILGEIDSLWPDERTETAFDSLVRLGMVTAPILGAVASAVFCYRRGTRRMPLMVLAGATASIALAGPLFHFFSHGLLRQPVVATSHTNSVSDIAWQATWNKPRYPYEALALEARWQLPAVSGLESPSQLHLVAGGWPILGKRSDLSPQWRDAYRCDSSGRLHLSHPDAHEDGCLTRSNGPLTVLLSSSFTLLNPRQGSPSEATASWGMFSSEWKAGQPFALEIGLKVETNDVVVLRRVPYPVWMNDTRHRTREPADGEAEESPRTVLMITPHLFQSFVSEPSETIPKPAKTLLWHPQRRELVLPSQTTANERRGHPGVLALAELFGVSWYQHRSIFPRLDKLLPAPVISERDWLAGAEVVVLAFKPVGTQYHVINVPNVWFPSLPPAAPKP